MCTNFWDPSEDLYGLFNVWSFRHIAAVVSSGLGGGSLIYANVLLRKDPKWFVNENLCDGGYEDWPVTYEDLDVHYGRVEKMIKPATYPYADTTPKTKAFREAALRRDLDWDLPPLAITFRPSEGADDVPGEPIEEAENLHGQTRSTCRLCGECDLGCNYGSKNTLDFNYLSEAKRLNADLRTLCEVKSFAPAPKGYTIDYVEHPDGTRRTVTATKLILAAGTLGTTFLLLNNRGAFPRISRRLGAGFSGNGDLLTFAVPKHDRVLDPSYGPVITSYIRHADQLDGGDGEGRGFYLEDAGFPMFATWLLQVFETPGVMWRWRLTAWALLRGLLRGRPDTDLGAELSKLFSKTDLSAGVLPLLGMGRDIPDGRMSLRDGRLDLDWRIDKSGPFFDRMRETSRQVCEDLDAKFVDNPIWHLGRQVISVHPLGGCRMGRTAEEGVVDPSGEVFGYPGLYVADGAAMPGPVGANPSLTIAAMADRFADRATHF